MNEQPLFSLRNPWFSASVGVTAAIAVLAAFAGLIWLPLAQPDLKLSGIWDAICSAAGVPRASTQADSIQPDFKTSNVVMTSEMLTRHDQVSIGRGATLAQRCAICHGPQGVSRRQFAESGRAVCRRHLQGAESISRPARGSMWS